jgi:hypothetical protein
LYRVQVNNGVKAKRDCIYSTYSTGDIHFETRNSCISPHKWLYLTFVSLHTVFILSPRYFTKLQSRIQQQLLCFFKVRIM